MLLWMKQDEEIYNQLIADFELGQMLQERIVPRAVMYFTGDAVDSANEVESDDDGDSDGDGDGNHVRLVGKF
jgi:nucleosome assembly protein 1-like 1